MTRRVASARLNGSLGGRTSSLRLTEEQREARARTAGNSLLSLYGKDYYSFIGKSKKHKKEIKEIVKAPPQGSNAARRLRGMYAG